MYNYAGYGNPLYNQQGFVHCGDCNGVSGAASDDQDKYISTYFDMSSYVGMSDVRLKFIVGMYAYQWPGDGEHWHIDSLSFTGTGMQSVAAEEVWDISGSGAGGAFVSGEAQTVGVDYYFQVPGEYKIVFDAWIGDNPSSGIDEFAGDNSVALSRETMFTIVGTTADETPLSAKNNEDNERHYSSGWYSAKDGGPKESFQWIPSATADSEPDQSPVWDAGTDAYGSPYDGDDTSLTSPVFDLSTATSAKLVFKHKYSFYGFEYPYASYYYDSGRIEISSDGDTWAPLNPTSGNGYGGVTYNYAYYGNPLSGQLAFVMNSGGWVETQCRLDSYTGPGFDNVQVRFRLGGYFGNTAGQTTWQIDNVGVYGLGFDLAQTSESSPYTLEVGEGFTMSTSFKNAGKGDLGPTGPIDAGYAYAYVNDMSGNELWSSSASLGNLAMAYYDIAGGTHAGESSAVHDFAFPGMTTAGLYTAGVKVADSNGDTLADLFMANNDESHMLIVGLSAEMGTPLLTGGTNWEASTNVPSAVGDGVGVSWDQTGVATESLSVSIAGQSIGFAPEAPSVQVGATVTWTNTDTITHTVTDKEAQFDSFDIGPGESWSLTFTEVGAFSYYCKYHPMMEGSLTVLSSQSADEQARTNYISIWSATAYLVFWADHDMSLDSEITVYAQKKGSSLNDADTLGLWGANGFTIMDGSDHSEVGDSVTGNSGGWNPYYISLDSQKLGYNSLDYDPADDNAYSFVFRARGVEGSVHIGGVEVIRTLDTGFFLTKDDVGQLTYDIFPSLAVEIDYFTKNIGTFDNTFRMTPELEAQGATYEGGAFDVSINVIMNGNTFEDITTSQNVDGTWTHEFDMSPDDEAMITVRFGAPDYDQEAGEPAGNRKFDVIVNGYDVGSDESLREPVAATLFIKPSQFVLGEMTFDRQGVIEGDSLAITVKAWNEGNYASDVLVVFYVMDSTGDAYSTPEGVKRMTRVASTTLPLMAPKPVLEDNGVWQTWYYATATWDESYIPGTTAQAFETVQMYAMINPDAEEQDVQAGVKTQDEYLNQKDDNDAAGTIAVVKNKASTPSFAVGIIGLSVAALVASIGASLRREEE
jgi:plastocyanin